MARPSMTALLAILAIAGYQHRDRIAEMLSRATAGGGSGVGAGGEDGRPGGQAQPGGPAQGGGAAMGAGIGGMIGGALQDLVDRFRQGGHGETAESWVRQGPNRPVEAQHLEQVLGEDTLQAVMRQTGLSREEVLARLSRSLPEAVDGFTPEGQLPRA